MKAVKFLTVACAVFFAAVLLVGNSAAQTIEPSKPDVTKSASVAPTSVEETIAANSRMNEKYRIGFQDTLEILVNKHAELSAVVNVSPDGTIRMPRIEQPIVAVCKTERELGEIIEKLYKVNLLKNPFVNVRAIEQRSQPFSVIGAVEKPGSFYLKERIKLFSLLSLAGGHDVEKSGSEIQVIRGGNTAGCVENPKAEQDGPIFVSYKIKDVTEGKENPWMKPGDIIYVPDADQAFVVGSVKKSKAISLKEPVTLMQAIAMAEGFEDTAKTNKIVIQRQDEKTNAKTSLVFSYKDIRDKKIADPFLQANDIVEVGDDTGKKFKKGFLDIIKSLAPGLPYGL